jgi:uroporphyrinogen-III synthase
VPDLTGFTVAVTADRRRDEQAVLLRKLGIEPVLTPLLQTEPDDLESLRRRSLEVIAHPPDYLLANTGFGMQSWFDRLAEWGLRDDLVAALRHTKVAARGPKAQGMLRKVGLELWYRAPGETLEEVTSRLLEEDLAGRRILFQLHGEPSPGVTEALEAAGATIELLAVYRMGEGGRQAAETLVNDILAGALDAVTFTAAPQVHALVAAAESLGCHGELVEAFGPGGVIAACIGPVCAAGATDEGMASPLVPEHWRLGSLVTLLGEHLARRQVVLAGDGSAHGRLSGSRMETGGREMTFAPEERRLVRRLLSAKDHVLSGAELARGGPPDPAVVSALIDRLDGALVREPDPASGPDGGGLRLRLAGADPAQ